VAQLESSARRFGRIGFMHQASDLLHSLLLALYDFVSTKFESGKMVTVSQPSHRISICKSFSFNFLQCAS
jgi:hypothetical protein